MITEQILLESFTYSFEYLWSFIWIIHHHHHHNIHFLSRLIMGIGGCFSTAYLVILLFRDFTFTHSDASIFEKILFSHHQAVVYAWESWNKFLVVGCLPWPTSSDYGKDAWIWQPLQWQLLWSSIWIFIILHHNIHNLPFEYSWSRLKIFMIFR